jgi:phosphoribosylaminoimidazole-succinocarboxamide synthase
MNKESLPPRLYEGSVKNVLGRKQDSHYIFEFTNKYSVFDWGEMPDQIEGKGLALARFTHGIYQFLAKTSTWSNWNLPADLDPQFAAYLSEGKIFSSIRKEGLRQHASEDSLVENYWKVKAVAVEMPVKETSGFDYSAYKSRPVNTLVPLEVIFRFGVGDGSSLPKRLEKNVEYMYSLGLQQVPRGGEMFTRPIIEFSTKLEDTDRFLTYSEAKKIAGLSEEEFENLFTTAALIALRLKDFFAQSEIQLWDGKFEFAFAEENLGIRNFELVDAIGPDELRLTFKNVQLSKEVIRQYYLSSSWYRKMEKAKEKAKTKMHIDWKEYCVRDLKSQPEKLPKDFKLTVEKMYQALALVVVEKKSTDLENVIVPLKKWLSLFKEMGA